MREKSRRPGLRSASRRPDPVTAFNECLNEVHPRVQFTREEEEENKIPFLDVLVTRRENGRLETEVYRKPSNTNVIIKPNSCHDPNIHAATLKGEIARATRICSSPGKLPSGGGIRCELVVN